MFHTNIHIYKKKNNLKLPAQRIHVPVNIYLRWFGERGSCGFICDVGRGSVEEGCGGGGWVAERWFRVGGSLYPGGMDLGPVGGIPGGRGWCGYMPC